MTTITVRHTPIALWIAGGLGLAWNLFGAVQYLGTAGAGVSDLMAGGMTAEQAALYAALPAWMTAAFALTVFGGIAGSALLLLRVRLALPVLALSLAAALVLFVGDALLGIFAAFGAPQVIVLSIVVAIAAGLTDMAARFARSGVLR